MRLTSSWTTLVANRWTVPVVVLQGRILMSGVIVIQICQDLIGSISIEVFKTLIIFATQVTNVRRWRFKFAVAIVPVLNLAVYVRNAAVRHYFIFNLVIVFGLILFKLVRQRILPLVRINGKAMDLAHIWNGPIVLLSRRRCQVRFQIICFRGIHLFQWFLDNPVKLRIILVLVWNLVIVVVVIVQNSKISVSVGVILLRHINMEAVFWTLHRLVWSTDSASSHPDILTLSS